MNNRHPGNLSACIMVFCLGLTSLSFAKVPQTHDVPMFHNDDGLGLLQDCELMRAIALGKITEIPTTVAGRSTSCLMSLKSVAHVLYSMQNTTGMSASCLPSADLDWLEVLEFVTDFMENQSADKLSAQPYGVWIMQALHAKYPCK